MAAVKDFEDLMIFQKARELSKKIYPITQRKEIKFDSRFVQQIRAAAGSIMDNIAEGFERGGNKEFVNFLYIAKGSCGETRSQLYRAFDYGYISEAQFEAMKSLSEDISKSISNFIDYLSNTVIKGSKFK